MTLLVFMIQYYLDYRGGHYMEMLVEVETGEQTALQEKLRNLRFIKTPRQVVGHRLHSCVSYYRDGTIANVLDHEGYTWTPPLPERFDKSLLAGLGLREVSLNY